jgi:hypothetical protein
MRSTTILFLALGVGCGAEDTGPEVVAQEAPEQASDAPPPAPEPEPLMRRPIHCCSDLVLEDALKAYIAIGTTLASGQTEGVEDQRQTFVAKVQELGEEHEWAAFVAPASALEGCELDACREAYGALSDALVPAVTGTHSGDLDIAIAWSRKFKHPWIQNGNELKSPYGDGIESYSWGSREEVESADAGREAQRRVSEPMNPVDGPPEGNEPPPVEADPPPGSNQAPPPERSNPPPEGADKQGEG